LFLLLIFFQVTVVSNCAMCSQATFLMALSHLRSEICCIWPCSADISITRPAPPPLPPHT
jgi:hypothetical protein